MTTAWTGRGAVATARAAATARGAATAIAAARTALGVVALASPSLVARPWVGQAGGPAARVLGRALGGRDLTLGLGALAALRRVPPGDRAAGGAGAWVGAGALADFLDLLTTAAAWPELPAAGRWLVAMSAGGSAVAGAAAAWSLLAAEPADGS